MKLLNIVSSGYRATVEEQDDTVIWISHCLRNAGAAVDLLLQGSAVNYPVRGQAVAPLAIGGRKQRHGPDVHAQVRALIDKGAAVYAVREDADARGIDPGCMLQEVELIPREALPEMLTRYDRVWQW